MEINEAILALFLVITLFSGGHSVRRSSVLDCCHHKSICKEDEYCSEDVISYLCKCERSKFRNHKKSYENNLNAQSKKPHRDLTKWNAAAEDTDDRLDQNKHYDEIKYDMTYFENHDSQTETPRESRRIAIKSKEINDQVLGRAQRQHYNFENFRHRNPSYQIKLRRTIEHKEHSDDTWPPIGIPLPIPRKRTRHYEIMERRDSKFGESKQKKETFQSNELDQKSEDGNALDLDIEIKPLSFSDSTYLEEEKTKLSSIPKKPIGEEEAPQKIEHIQTNIIDKNPAKKAEVGVLIGGRLDQEKANIIHQKSQDQTYDKVKDFFKSQQVSSIVDVPVADKKKSVRFYSLPPEEKDVNVRRSSIPSPSVYPDGVKLDLKERLDANKASDLLDVLQDLLWGSSDRKDAFTSVETEDNTVFFHVLNNTTTKGDKPSTVVERINKDDSLKNALHKAVGVTVLAASLKSKEPEEVKEEDENFMITTFIVAGCVTGILLASVCIFIILRRSQENSRWVPKQVGQEAASDYQSLWRQLRQATWEAPVQTSPVAHVSNEDQKRFFANKDMPPKYSWSEEPVDTKMDISTGHAVLSYMEDHLKNENRLSREWEELSVYEAEPNQTDAGKDPKNSKKNRYTDVLPFDHNRVKLRETSNATGSDYINASYIIDDDPRNAAYIATQGPLGTTVADFWQMVWEQGVVVIVMLTKLADLGLPQCHRYWPEKGHAVYHIYQVHLISEHIWCSDYLVRSFYLKNVQTGETRTVTQFHYLTWPHLGIPASSKPLLDFRRKVHKCYRNLACPVLVHCSGGIDRTGTYILIDMVLSKMSKGTKEIDIAATLEHLRDQRPQMVKTKAQFEFALTSVAEEVNAILQVLTKH